MYILIGSNFHMCGMTAGNAAEYIIFQFGSIFFDNKYFQFVVSALLSVEGGCCLHRQSEDCKGQ
jgi:hypothetical protein